jgi:uncharacterized membrane protein
VRSPGPPSSTEAPEELAFDYARTVALSDGVFAIALTLLVLSISTPVLAPGHESALAGRLLDRQPEFLSYAISFAVIALLWVRHHGFFGGLARIDGRITVLNLLYLGLVAFLPYPTRILGLYGDQPAAIVLYALCVTILALVAGAMRVHAVRAGLLSEAGRRHLARREHWGLVPAIFLLSIPVAFVSTTAALLSWLLIAVVPRLTGRRRRAARPGPGQPRPGSRLPRRRRPARRPTGSP